MFTHSSREPHGVRWWLHYGDRSCLHIEFYWWSRFCGVTVGTDDEGWNLSLRLPPLAFYLSLEGMGLWQPQRKCIATWDNDREFVIPDRREFDVSVSDWTLRFTPWGRWGEWRTKDPWWIRGLSFNIPDFILGRTRYHTVDVKTDIPLLIPMPEGSYKAVAKISRNTWKRSRWFTRTRDYVDVQIPKGIPFAGKGENSWDCGDDGLFGYSSEGTSLETAIAKGVESVLQSRRKYGHASADTIREALA